MRIGMVWTVIDRLSSIWKSDLSNKIKRDFFRIVVVLVLLYSCTTLMKCMKKKARCKLQKNAMSCFEQTPGVASIRTASIRSLTSHLTNHSNKTRRCRRIKNELINHVLQSTQTLIFISYVRILYAIERTSQKLWTIRTDGQKETMKSVLTSCLDDDHNYVLIIQSLFI